MYKNKKILALITARGGSKRLPRKNIRLLCAKPLVAWTIKQAKASRYIDRLIVSTDDKEIAEISKRYKAEVPFLRPKFLAEDNTKSIDVILHVLEWLEKQNQIYDILLLLQPTSPLRILEDIDRAIKLLFYKDTQAIVSVCDSECRPNWINTLPEDKCMKDFTKLGLANKNKRGHPKYYRLNGAIYLAFIEYLKKQKTFFGAKTFAYIMPQERSIDIDNEVDFMFADFLLEKMTK